MPDLRLSEERVLDLLVEADVHLLLDEHDGDALAALRKVVREQDTLLDAGRRTDLLCVQLDAACGPGTVEGSAGDMIMESDMALTVTDELAEAVRELAAEVGFELEPKPGPRLVEVPSE